MPTFGAQDATYDGRMDMNAGAYAFKAEDKVTIWMNLRLIAPSSPVSDDLGNEVLLAASAGGYGDASKMRRIAEDIAVSAQDSLENIARN
ncbi:hypothetical protein [Hyphococcus luteus]|uniref:Uncharacterized protein n=1 Tax=Hyphococcus luteus TaxID=2058213 RepID=A0A2S7K1N8_9PROT|nr:hypothetical protein [Marinicaulis flavus]PQA86425.1 hypothetical protein CW354_19030 [Marinicaulis flavus]